MNAQEKLILACVTLAAAVMILFLLWLYQYQQTKDYRRLYKELRKEHSEFIHRFGHCCACDFCDFRDKCTKYIAGKVHYACPFWSFKKAFYKDEKEAGADG